MIEWKGRGDFVANMLPKDLKELRDESMKENCGRLACAICGNTARIWICDVRVFEGSKLEPGDIRGLVLCDIHGKPLINALELIRK